MPLQNNDTSDWKRAPKPKVPDDFDSEEDFLSYARKLYSEDVGADRENREEALVDHKFVAGRQWDENVYQRRLNLKKPALTFNLLTAFVAQLVGNYRQSESVPKVVPLHDEYKEAARVREGLMRSIIKNSKAERAFGAAFENCVIGGLGNFQLVMDYADDDVFDQEIRVDPIYDTAAVAWDHRHVDPTGADARHVFVTDRMARAEFEKRYPDANPANWESDYTDYARVSIDGWVDQNSVRIADFWRVRSRRRLLALTVDGKTIDVTDEPATPELQAMIQTDTAGRAIIRETDVRYAELYVMCGGALLEGPYELPIKRVPVFRVPAWEINTGDYKTRFGLIRWARDPQRLYNYWKSVEAEKLMLTAKAKWIGPFEAFQGYEDEWNKAHLSDQPILRYNGEAGTAPIQVPPVQMEPALIQKAQESAQEIKDILNIHEAALGMTSNEVSGKAIMARQRAGDLGTVVYQDNLRMAVEECGRVINDLIPYIYDAPRVIKVLGADANISPAYVRVNYGDEASVDLTDGKYDVTITTGPNYDTKRVESAEVLKTLANAMPEVFSTSADLLVKAMDIPDADLIAERIQYGMPAGYPGKPVSQQEQAAMQQQQQMQQLAIQLEMEEKRLELLLKQANIEEKRAKARKTIADIENDDERTEAELARTASDIESQQTRDALQAIDAFTGENNV